jgi:hypothetical protein
MAKTSSALALFVALGLTGPAAAQSFILCTAPDKEDLVIELDSMIFEGETLSCLRGGGGVIYDMTPCAPDGGYGLSYPTGSAGLLKVVHRWQDYGDHMGGVASFTASETEFRFEGGFMFPDSGYSEAWSFTVSRLTGAGDLAVVQEVEEGGEVGRSHDQYNCAAVSRKF